MAMKTKKGTKLMSTIEKRWQKRVEKDISGLSHADLLDYIIEHTQQIDPHEDCFHKFASDFAAQKLKDLMAVMQNRLDTIDDNDTSDGLAMYRCGC